jgi:predicted amidohydrolase
MTPENTGLIGANRAETLAQGADRGRACDARRLPRVGARDRAWFLLGSIHVRVPGEEQIRNRSYLIDSDGGLVASYDKIHMFDVQLAGGESYRESSTFRPGERSVLAETPWGVLGMTICYDLRFPYLYRDLAHAGATMLSIPSSFTVPTGKAHWHTLMRARAIETGCFVFAPAQVGTHKGSTARPTAIRSRSRRGARCWPMPAAKRGLRDRRGRPRQGRRGAQNGALAAARPEILNPGAAEAGRRQGGGVALRPCASQKGECRACAPRSVAPWPSRVR